MPNRVSRRERRRRLYFLRAVCARMLRVAGDPAYNLPAAFDVEPATFGRWLTGQEAVPAWVVAIAINAYRIPEPRPRPLDRPLVLTGLIVLVVLAGAAAVLALAR